MIVRHWSSLYKGLVILVSLASVFYLLRYFFGDKTPYPYFASKTSYFHNANLDESPVSVPGCTPVMFWFLTRHGARNPDKAEIMEMGTRLPSIRDAIVAASQSRSGELEKSVIQKLRKWKLASQIEAEMHLTDSGKKEQEEMGKRWRKRLMHLLEDRRKILVRATQFERTRESAKFFLKGVFEKERNDSPSIDVTKVPPSSEFEEDCLLRFMDNCPKYTKDVVDNNETAAEAHRLEQYDAYGDMLDDVRAKAGVNLSSGDVWWIWDICRFEMAWWPNDDSPWCHFFSKRNLKMLEYKEDLKRYYTFAYGQDINWQMTQPIFSDIYSKFEQARAGKSNLTGVLYFAHAETIGPLLAALGLYHDEKDLQATDWPNHHYKWRSSRIIPFSANLGLVLLRCGLSSVCLRSDCGAGGGEVWKLITLHQERRVKLPACEQEVCHLDEFTDYYGQLEKNTLENVCHVD